MRICFLFVALLQIAGILKAQPNLTGAIPSFHFNTDAGTTTPNRIFTADQSVAWSISPIGAAPAGVFSIIPTVPAIESQKNIVFTAAASNTVCPVENSYNLRITNTGGEIHDYTLTACKNTAPVAKPIEVVMVIDVSGSMGDPGECTCMARPNCVDNANPGRVSKLEYLKSKVADLFLEMKPQLDSDPANKFGMVTFHSTVATPITPLTAFNSMTPPTLSTQMATLTGAGSAAGSLQPRLMTSMGGGLKAAIDMLGGIAPDNTKKRVILLLTDGMQNENPMVSYTGGVITINSTPSVTLNGTDIKIIPFAIFTPDGSYLDLLDQIGVVGGANDVGVTTTPYVCGLTQPLETNWIAGVKNIGSPKLLHFRTSQMNGSNGQETYTVTESVDMITFDVSAVGTHNITGIKVEKITGGAAVDITALGHISPDLATPSQFRVFNVSFPLAIPGGANTAGEYRVSFTSDQPNLTYDASVVVDDRGLKQSFFASSVIEAGSPMFLGAHLYQANTPVTDASIKAIIYAPKKTLDNAFAKKKVPGKYINIKGPWGPLFPKEGLSSIYHKSNPEGAFIKQISISHPTLPSFQKEQSKMSLGEKKYLVLMNETNFSEVFDQEIIATIPLVHQGGGVYNATFNGTQNTGIYHVRFEAEGNHPVIGAYKRIDEKTPFVRFGIPDRKKSSLYLLYESPAILSLKPVDTEGNLLGPNQTSAILVKTSNGDGFAESDYLNGRYLINLPLSPNPDPEITISIHERILFKGLLSDLYKKRTFVSLHGGITQPQSDFSAQKDNGYYGEAKLGYRIYRQLSIQAKGGYYAFKDSTSGKVDYAIGGVGLGLAYRQWLNLLTGVFLQAEINAAYYKPESTDWTLGYNGGISLLKPVNHVLNVALSFDRHSIQTTPKPIAFNTIGLGLQLRF